MANDDEAKAAAAKAKADKAEAAKPAKAEAEAAAKADAKEQDHVVTRDVMHDGEVYSPGDKIGLTRKQHAQLFAGGAVAEDWRD